jgi:ribosomal protein S18 acetylase RimI-like enzyme
MTRDEVMEISKIVDKDKFYAHFVRRINKDFEASSKERNANIFVLYSEKDGKKIGFCVVSYSPNKMKMWEKTFKEEGWCQESFKINQNHAFELMYLYIKPDFRQEGYGHRLFANALSKIKKKGGKELYAYVSDRSRSALNFYIKKKGEIIHEFFDDDTKIKTAYISWRI